MIYDGKPAVIASPPLNTKFEEKIVFKPGMKGTSKQIGPWHGLTLHWTGSENKADGVISTLKERGLSIHFIVDPDGKITQAADLNTRCSHCGVGNSYFIGVEMVCRGYANKADLAVALLKNPDLRQREEIDWEAERDVYTDTIARERVNMAAFNPAQIKSAVWLAETLARLFSFHRRIPAAVCRDTSAKALAGLPLRNPQDHLVSHDGMPWLPSFDRELTWRPSNFKGCISHFAIHPTKHDCGTQPLWALWRAGWNPAEVILHEAE